MSNYLEPRKPVFAGQIIIISQNGSNITNPNDTNIVNIFNATPSSMFFIISCSIGATSRAASNCVFKFFTGHHHHQL